MKAERNEGDVAEIPMGLVVVGPATAPMRSSQEVHAAAFIDEVSPPSIANVFVVEP